LYKRFKLIYDALICILFIVFLTFILVQIVARFILHVSVPWTEEWSRFIAVFFTFLGAAVVSRKGEHLGVYFLRDQLKGRPLSGLLVVNHLVSAVFLIVLTFGSLLLYSKQSPNVVATTAKWFPLRDIYLITAVGLAITAVYEIKGLRLCAKALRNKTRITEIAGRSTPFPEE